MSRWSAIFLDRDGTVNVKAPEGRYVTRPGDLVLLPGVGGAIRRLKDAEIPVHIVTNQRGVARGLMSIRDLDAVHDRMRHLLASAGATVDGIYSCTHAAGSCDCRKPLPGLLHRAVADNPGTALAHSAVVGDAASDVIAGIAAGCTTVRLAAVPDPAATATVRSLPQAVQWLLDSR